MESEFQPHDNTCFGHFHRHNQNNRATKSFTALVLLQVHLHIVYKRKGCSRSCRTDDFFMQHNANSATIHASLVERVFTSHFAPSSPAGLA